MRAADRASAVPALRDGAARRELRQRPARAQGRRVHVRAGRRRRTPGADVEELRRPLPDDLAGPRA
ncbi:MULTISPECIES: hypothetical protein [Streptomyces]|uniref:hypothetical protein n=1 Tax=Streptomyces TaxID=1883 RepID=UPI000A7A6B4F|nr:MULTISPECIES: hypothetical protein [Streptomyces]